MFYLCYKVGAMRIGLECWNHCNKKSGRCDFCGTGMCCRRGEQYEVNGCKSWWGGANRHECVGNPLGTV